MLYGEKGNEKLTGGINSFLSPSCVTVAIVSTLLLFLHVTVPPRPAVWHTCLPALWAGNISHAHRNMAEPLEGNARRKGVILSKGIVYGNVARYFGKKREDDGHTHGWTVYLRPYKSEDMGVFIKKVQFKLHESYPTPVRLVNRPPYELNETGWGEFEIAIKIFFTDPAEKPVTIFHLLKLFQTDPAVVAGKRSVVSEYYDELVFTDPTNTMYHLLTTPKPLVPAVRHEAGVDYREIEERTLSSLNSGQKKIKLEIQDLSDRLKMTKEAIQKLREQLDEMEDGDAP